jgi:murein DD-endopeptidase MepM/ murein hydrolase activator NlpD
VRHLVTPGDNLYLVLTRLGVAPATVAALMEAQGDTRPLQNLRPGRELLVDVRNGVLESLRYEIDPLAAVHVVRAGDSYRAQLVEQPSQRVQRTVYGTIENSLYLAAQDAGLSDPMILAVADLFGWDIDFTMDLQPGDRFAVVLEEVHSRGVKVRDGAILAAEFMNRDRVLRAVRYTDASGRSAYYTPEGRSLRKAFSRNPLPVTRITSRFNPNRLHPIFKTRRPHRGVDYGAPTGTPVRATGDGVVAYAGRKGGYGNALILQHGKSYRTLYGHLSRFAPGMRAGRRVRQGELIAFVGATGWATGPHLHYEFQVNGVHKDPLRVALPPAPEVPAAELARFRALASPTLAELDAVAATYRASR